MQIDFFEEFLDDACLSKAAMIRHKCLVFLACRSLEEFDDAKARLRRIQPVVEAGYWPLLEKSYWISPFSYLEEIETLRSSLLSRRDRFDVLLDLELPIIRRSMLLKGLPGFFRKKRRISEVMRELARTGYRLHTAEYPPTGPAMRLLMRVMGVSYTMEAVEHQRIVMYYTSMLPGGWIFRAMQKELGRSAARFGSRFAAGVGTIGVGIFGNEPRLAPEELRRDLAFLVKVGVARAVIFRLGGLTQEYVDVIANGIHT